MRKITDFKRLLSPTGLADDCFANPVGISDESTIPDKRLTASSYYNDGYQPAYGRLNGDRGDGWCAKEATRYDDWLQVDLGKKIKVCGTTTQGDINANEWTTAFKLSYSSDGNTWATYSDANGTDMVRMYVMTNINFDLNKRTRKYVNKALTLNNENSERYIWSALEFCKNSKTFRDNSFISFFSFFFLPENMPTKNPLQRLLRLEF